MMQPVLVRLTNEDRAQLEEEAHKKGQSLSEILRQAVKVYLNHRPKQKSGAEVLLEWTKKEKKVIKNNLNSQNYKQHLYK